MRELRRQTGLTQAQLAERAGTSQPTIAAYELGYKSPTIRTLSGLVESVDLQLVVSFVRPLTREDRRSIALHRAIAEKLTAQPAAVSAHARRNLRRLWGQHQGTRPLVARWRELLKLPVHDLADLLVDPRNWMRDLRQVTPFAGILSAAERTAVYRRFQESEREATA